MKNFLVFAMASVLVLFAIGCGKGSNPTTPIATVTAVPTTVPDYQIISIPSSARVGQLVIIYGANFDEYALVDLTNPNGGPESDIAILPSVVQPNMISFIVPAINTSQINDSTIGTNYVQIYAYGGRGGGFRLSNSVILNVTP